MEKPLLQCAQVDKLQDEVFDVVIIGAGVSGSFLCQALTEAGQRCLVLEAGEFFSPSHYPRNEIDSSSRLYWSGGIELNDGADIGLLRPKVVGGGSVVNQALVDRFDDLAWDSWRESSRIDWFRSDQMKPWYEKAESHLSIQKIPAEFRNGNAKIFEQGLRAQGFGFAPLSRAQKDCAYETGNDCIECLAGCPIQSKQSMPWTLLKEAEQTGLMTLVPRFEVVSIQETSECVEVRGILGECQPLLFRARKCALASGAIGNAKILFESKKMNAAFLTDALRAEGRVGERFYCHPQMMHLAVYDQEIHAEKGPFQALKSDDARFRTQGFKLENVFAPPASIAMLLPGIGAGFMKSIKEITRMACMEVAIRDQTPGRIQRTGSRKHRVTKALGAEDRKRMAAGTHVIHEVFRSTGAKAIIPGTFAIGLHLMGGLSMGERADDSVVGPDFRLHGAKNIFSADSSVFPNAPGINPSLTIMAMSLRAAQEILR